MTPGRKFEVDTLVRYSAEAGPEYQGKVAGTIIGYSANAFAIVLLASPARNGDRAQVCHDSVLETV